MRSYLKYIVYIFVIYSFSACKKDLEVPSTNSITSTVNPRLKPNNGYELVGDNQLKVKRKFIIAADPQAYRLMDSEPGYNGDPNSTANRNLWEQINKRTVNSMKSLSDIQFAMINGDISEFGRRNSWSSFYKVYRNTYFPILIGLGNHDYANNINDCYDFPTYPISSGCAYQSINELVAYVYDFIYSNPNLNISFDFTNHTGPFLSNYSDGSLAYGFKFGDIHFIQLNNFPTYSVYIQQFPVTHRLVYKSLDWLEQYLAKNRPTYTILNFHDASDHFIDETSDADRIRFKNILKKYNVSAIFAGHTHSFSQLDNKNFYGDVHVFIAGALFNGQYYQVTYESNLIYDKPISSNNYPKKLKVYSTLTIDSIDGKDGIAKIIDSKTIVIDNRELILR